MTRDVPRSFVKSCGGKVKLAALIRPYMPKNPTAYHEPCVGGGAMFFRYFRDVRPAYLSDTNERLIVTYHAVRDDVEAVICHLRSYIYNRATYLLIRRWFNGERRPVCDAERAAWFIYLSKCCINGLYRENAAGGYNVPFGQHKNPRICDEENLRACSAALQGVSIECEDFEKAFLRVESTGAALYVDSPYIPDIDGKNFTRYGKHFGIADHVRLSQSLRRLDGLGVRVVASNSDTWVTRDIYRGFKMRQIVASRSIGAGAARRAPALELIIHNRERAA